MCLADDDDAVEVLCAHATERSANSVARQAHGLPSVVMVVHKAQGLHDGQSLGNLDPYVKATPVGWVRYFIFHIYNIRLFIYNHETAAAPLSNCPRPRQDCWKAKQSGRKPLHCGQQVQ